MHDPAMLPGEHSSGCAPTYRPEGPLRWLALAAARTAGWWLIFAAAYAWLAACPCCGETTGSRGWAAAALVGGVLALAVGPLHRRRCACAAARRPSSAAESLTSRR